MVKSLAMISMNGWLDKLLCSETFKTNENRRTDTVKSNPSIHILYDIALKCEMPYICVILIDFSIQSINSIYQSYIPFHDN